MKRSRMQKRVALPVRKLDEAKALIVLEPLDGRIDRRLRVERRHALEGRLHRPGLAARTRRNPVSREVRNCRRRTRACAASRNHCPCSSSSPSNTTTEAVPRKAAPVTPAFHPATWSEAHGGPGPSAPASRAGGLLTVRRFQESGSHEHRASHAHRGRSPRRTTTHDPLKRCVLDLRHFTQALVTIRDFQSGHFNAIGETT